MEMLVKTRKRFFVFVVTALVICSSCIRENAKMSPSPIAISTSVPMPSPIAISTSVPMGVMIEVGGELPPGTDTVLPPEALLLDTYQDPCYGYSISYPVHWWPVEKGLGISLAGVSYMSVHITIMPELHQSLDEMIEQQKAQWQGVELEGDVSEERMELNEQEAWIVTSTQPDARMTTKSVLIVANDIGYELSFALPINYYSELQPLIETIISSFIIGQPEVSCTSLPPRDPLPTVWDDPSSEWCRFSVTATANLLSASEMKVIWSGPSEPGGVLADTVYLYNLETGDQIKIAEAIKEGGGEKHVMAQSEGEMDFAPAPNIYDDRVVWSQAGEGAEGRYVIKIYDLSTDQITTIAAVSPYFLTAPDVYGDRIIYLKAKEVPDDSAPRGFRLHSDVYLYDLRTGMERRVSTSGKASQPGIWGNNVVWLEDWVDDSGAWLGANVFFHDLLSGQTRQLTRGEGADLLSVGKSFVTWHEADLDRVTAYNLAKAKMEVIDRGFVGKTYTANQTLVWIWSDPNRPTDSTARMEIRAIAPCVP